jgi:hypothetical protein
LCRANGIARSLAQERRELAAKDQLRQHLRGYRPRFWMSRTGFWSLAVILPVLCFLPWLAQGASDSACISCHEGQLFREIPGGNKEPLRFEKTDLRDSVHRVLKCAKCHRDITTLPHGKKLAKVECSQCHKTAERPFLRSVHGLAFKRGDKDAPSCTTCHGSHRIFRVSDERSPVYRGNTVLLCSKCHTDVDVQKTHRLPSSDLIKAYENSVHGRFLKEGRNRRAAVCSDCHGGHLILRPEDPESRTNKVNITSVCGRCHVQEYNEYKLSIHSKALQEGKLESPGCTDCHGEHTLMVVRDPKAGVYAKNVPTTCARCHANQEIIRKYRLPSDRYSSYIGSFHGVAIKYGDVTAANCTSCHEVHRILPALDPESSINPSILNKTCGKCHPAMREAVSLGKIHVEAKRASSRGMYYVRKFYTWFIAILMVLFVGYIALDVYGRIRRRKHGERR